MARLVLGTDKNNTGTSALVRDVSPDFYIEKTVVDGKLYNSSKMPDFSKITEIAGENALRNAFYSNKDLTEIDFC